MNDWFHGEKNLSKNYKRKLAPTNMAGFFFFPFSEDSWIDNEVPQDS